MITPLLVITASWMLNAMMDAIDHGKGAQTLGSLWHRLKWLSYALPFGYIIWVNSIKLCIVLPFIALLWVAWEVLYRLLRSINFHKFDT